jgi:1,4-alpha-glucan branching enzyme
MATFFSLSDEKKKEMSHLVSFYPHYMSNEEHILYFSHDQIVENRGSLYQMMKGTVEERWLQVRLFLSFMMTLPGGKLLFNGCESCMKEPWTLDRNILDMNRREESHSIQNCMKELNKLYVEYPAFHNSCDFRSFSWIEWDIAKNGCLAFLRHGGNDTFMIIHNFMSFEVACEYHLECASTTFLLSSNDLFTQQSGNIPDTTFTENGLFSILMPPFTCHVFKIYEKLQRNTQI